MLPLSLSLFFSYFYTLLQNFIRGSRLVRFKISLEVVAAASGRSCEKKFPKKRDFNIIKSFIVCESFGIKTFVIMAPNPISTISLEQEVSISKPVTKVRFSFKKLNPIGCWGKIPITSRKKNVCVSSLLRLLRKITHVRLYVEY
jgi:hypothetical protein